MAAQEAEMTDLQIASAVGVSQGAVSRWLAGTREPRGDIVIKLVKVVPGFGRLMGLEAA
jgi:transcriptional regulator with XRE-family HTH domain